MSICGLLTVITVIYSAGPPAASRGCVLVTNVLDKSLAIVKPHLGKEIARVPVTGIDPDEVEAFPRQVAVSAAGQEANVSTGASRAVGIIGVKEWKIRMALSM